MGYTQNNPLPRMKSALKMRKAEKKSGLHRNSALHNAEKYGIQGNDELDYMPIMDHGAATPMHRDGSMKGDQSATDSDYKDFKDTDPDYHGEDGESHGDQSATRTDYENK